MNALGLVTVYSHTGTVDRSGHPSHLMAIGHVPVENSAKLIAGALRQRTRSLDPISMADQRSLMATCKVPQGVGEQSQEQPFAVLVLDAKAAVEILGSIRIPRRADKDSATARLAKSADDPLPMDEPYGSAHA